MREWSGVKPFLCSKAAPEAAPDNAGWGVPNPVDTAYPEGSVTRSVETSLRLLGVDCIDLLQLHQYWPIYQDAGTWLQEMQALQQAGKIRYIGISCTDHRSDGAISIVRS